MRRLGLIGHPVQHSLSPLIHQELMRHAGIKDAQYDLWDIAPSKLDAYLTQLQQDTDIIGANITVPHKIATFQWANRNNRVADSMTKKLGAVNTFVRTPGQPTVFTAYNTDVLGAAHSLVMISRNRPNLTAPNIIVIGNGGAVAPIELAAASLPGAKVSRLFRRDATNWARRARLLETCDILINASSGGMVGAEPLDINIDPLPATAVVWDIVYAPLETPLLAQARARKLLSVNGIHMLVAQAIESFQLWFPKAQKTLLTDAFEPICHRCIAELQQRAGS